MVDGSLAWSKLVVANTPQEVLNARTTYTYIPQAFLLVLIIYVGWLPLDGGGGAKQE